MAPTSPPGTPIKVAEPQAAPQSPVHCEARDGSQPSSPAAVPATPPHAHGAAGSGLFRDMARSPAMRQRISMFDGAAKPNTSPVQVSQPAPATMGTVQFPLTSPATTGGSQVLQRASMFGGMARSPVRQSRKIAEGTPQRQLHDNALSTPTLHLGVEEKVAVAPEVPAMPVQAAPSEETQQGTLASSGNASRTANRRPAVRSSSVCERIQKLGLK